MTSAAIEQQHSSDSWQLLPTRAQLVDPAAVRVEQSLGEGVVES
jgi:hypothetical protein